MKYNDILSLNVSNDIKQIYINIYDDVKNDDEIEYLAFINYTIESSDIFLDNSIFNYDHIMKNLIY